jgi:hypothetical protein
MEKEHQIEEAKRRDAVELADEIFGFGVRRKCGHHEHHSGLTSSERDELKLTECFDCKPD